MIVVPLPRPSDESSSDEREAIARAQRCRKIREAREAYADRRFVAIAALVLLSAGVSGFFMMGIYYAQWAPLAATLGLWCLSYPTLRRMLDRTTVGL